MPRTPQVQLVAADWKDTTDLLGQLKKALKTYNVTLQCWDVGTDDTTVTVSRKPITEKQCSGIMNEMYETDIFHAKEEEI